MRRQMLPVGLALVLTCFWLLALTPARAGASPDACALYTNVDAEGLFQRPVSSGVPRTTMFPAGESCRYSITEKGDSYGITVRVATTETIKEEGIYDSTAEIMARQKKARQASGYAAENFVPVAELGDDAFWNGTDLWVLQGDTLLIIKIHSVLEGSFKDMAAAQNARGEQDLVLSQQAARTILPRLK